MKEILFTSGSTNAPFAKFLNFHMKNLKNTFLAGAIALASCNKEKIDPTPTTPPISTPTAKDSTFRAVFDAISMQTSPTGNGKDGQSIKVYPLSSITAKNGRDQTAPTVNLTLPTGWTRSVNGDTATLNNAPAGVVNADFIATVADFSTKNSTGGTNTFKGTSTKFSIQKTIDPTPTPTPTTPISSLTIKTQDAARASIEGADTVFAGDVYNYGVKVFDNSGAQKVSTTKQQSINTPGARTITEDVTIPGYDVLTPNNKGGTDTTRFISAIKQALKQVFAKENPKAVQQKMIDSLNNPPAVTPEEAQLLYQESYGYGASGQNQGENEDIAKFFNAMGVPTRAVEVNLSGGGRVWTVEFTLNGSTSHLESTDLNYLVLRRLAGITAAVNNKYSYDFTEAQAADSCAKYFQGIGDKLNNAGTFTNIAKELVAISQSVEESVTSGKGISATNFKDAKTWNQWSKYIVLPYVVSLEGSRQKAKTFFFGRVN